MLRRLADRELTVGELAEPLEMSLPAASEHLQVLEKAGLVQRTVMGRRHVCRLAPGFRHIAIQVDDVNTIVDGLRDDGFDTVGEVQDCGDTWRLVYVRGPEGLIVELAERLAAE